MSNPIIVLDYPDIIARAKRNKLIADAVREWRRTARARIDAETAYQASYPRAMDLAQAAVDADRTEMRAFMALVRIADEEAES